MLAGAYRAGPVDARRKHYPSRQALKVPVEEKDKLEEKLDELLRVSWNGLTVRALLAQYEVCDSLGGAPVKEAKQRTTPDVSALANKEEETSW